MQVSPEIGPLDIDRTAAIFVNDIYPFFCRLLRKEPATGRAGMRLGQMFTLFLGAIIISQSLYFAGVKGTGIFDHMMIVGVVVGTPTVMPLLLGLFIKRVPRWSALFSMGCAVVPAVLGFLSGKFEAGFLAERWAWHNQLFLNIGTGTAAFLATMPFWRRESPAYKARVEAFFTKMKTPVDFEREVGTSVDDRQFRIIGGFCMALGGAIGLLMLIPNPPGGRLCFLFVSAFIMVVGAGLWGFGRSAARKVQAFAAAEQAVAGTEPATTKQ